MADVIAMGWADAVGVPKPMPTGINNPLAGAEASVESAFADFWAFESVFLSCTAAGTHEFPTSSSNIRMSRKVFPGKWRVILNISTSAGCRIAVYGRQR